MSNLPLGLRRATTMIMAGALLGALGDCRRGPPRRPRPTPA